jgi:hypothetical protein
MAAEDSASKKQLRVIGAEKMMEYNTKPEANERCISNSYI